MVNRKKWAVLFTKAAMKDAKKLLAANLTNQTDKILDVLQLDPHSTIPPFEKLVGNLSGCYSRRINIKHRIVYEIHEDDRTVIIFRMFSHYSDN